MTKVELAGAVEMTSRRIAQYENEGGEPPPSTVSQLARALDVPEGFFFAAREPIVLAAEDVSFRSLARLSARSRDAALAGASLAAEVSEWFEREFDLPQPSLPDLRDLDPLRAAAALRSEWALGEAPIPNMVHLVEAHGVRVFSLVDNAAALDAISAWVDDRPYIFLTHHKSPERARWDVAHELGHLVLHLSVPPQGRQHEDEADEFARELLMPDQAVKNRATPYPSLTDVRREKVHWRVSALAYIRRLYGLQLITERQYKSLVIEATQAGYRRREGDIARESSQVLPQILGTLRSEGVTLRQIADRFSLRPKELRGLLFSPITGVVGESDA